MVHSYPAGEPFGHVDDLSVGVHDLVATIFTGVLRRVVPATQALWYSSTHSHQFNVQPACYLYIQAEGVGQNLNLLRTNPCIQRKLAIFYSFLPVC